NIFIAINLKTRLPIENPVEVVLKEKKIVRISEHTALLSKDNREYLISDSAAPIKDKNGNIQGVILVFSDITDKYYAEEALKRSEERLQLTLECTNIGVWDWDIVHDKWYASPSFYSMLGYKAEVEASDKDIWNQRIHPEDRQLAKKVIKEALIGKEESYQYEARMLHRNGTYRWHNVFGYIIDRDSTGYATRLVGIRIDITEKKLSEISLKESEKFFTAIFEQAIVGVAEIDTDTGRFLNVNKKYADIVGYSVEEMLELDFLKITHPQDLEIDLQFMKQLKSNEIREFCMDKRYFHKDGGIRWVNLSVTPLWRLGQKPDKHIAIVQDITEKKLAEENIQNVQRTLSTLISNLQGLAYRCKNDKKWTMEFMSEGIKELSGYSAEDFVENKTLSYNDVIHPEDTEYVFNEVQKAVRNRKHFTLTYRIIDSSEREKWVLEKGLPIFSSEGDLLSIEGFITDITERKMAELEISRLLEEKEIILKEVHHRVKNNMMAIHSLLSIHANISDNPKTYEILQDAARRIHSMASLYDKLFHSSNFTDMSLQDYLKPLI
ncbi:MAG: PAS domain S-box protein, partial [Leptospiraceae bacterium]|nr:PAS domain S-box protein [Leptospiraceae bacterium]